MVCFWWMFVRVLFSCFDLDQIPQVEQCKGACEWECHMLSLWPFCILWALVNILTPCLMVVQQHEMLSCTKLLRDLGSLSYCSASSQGLMNPQCRMWAQHPCSHGFSRWFQCTEKMGRAQHLVLASFAWLKLYYVSRSLSHPNPQGLEGGRQSGWHKLHLSMWPRNHTCQSFWLLSLCWVTWPKQLWGK